MAQFSTIDNILEMFTEADMSFEEFGVIMVANILVRLDLREGFLEELEIEMEMGIFT